jgi:hypothetical protein
MYYRGYILVRLKIIGEEWKVVEKISGLKSTEAGENWEVSYATPVYGGWDLIIECSFTKLEELDKIVTALRSDSEIASAIEETTTLCGTKPNYSKN